MEDVKKDRKKIFKVFTLIISIILIITLGTYAWLTWSSTDNTELTMTIGELAEIKFITGNDISTTNLAPVLDYNDGKSTTFSIKSRTDTTFESDVILNVTSIDSALQVDSFKYVILESSDNNNFNIIKEGSFKDISTGINVIKDISIQPRTLKYYKFIIYIDGNMENDVNMMGKSISGTLSIEASYVEPNAPKLTDELIPVTYDESKSSWVKADSNNNDNSWYDYGNKKWANAVLVTDTNRNTYQSAESGTEILEEEILVYYVWIPRYKYRVWNITKTVGVDSYDAYSTGIDILFETGTTSTGTITCNDYSFASPNSSTPNETCSGNNGEYYTHPAFTFGDTEVEGIWVGKFEVSSSDPTAEDGGGESTVLTVRVKPNVTSWRNNPVSNFSHVIQNMQVTDNEYGLTTDKTVADSHMMKNMEWGAVAYLTNSNYGRCSNGTCSEVTINNSSSYITGNAGDSISASGASGITNSYNSTKKITKIVEGTGTEMSSTKTDDATYPWTETDGVLSSGNAGTDDSTSTLIYNFTLSQKGAIILDYSVSSESGYDILTIKLDDITLLEESGTSRGTSETSLVFDNLTQTAEAGSHILTIIYEKDGSSYDGLDKAYIKNIKVLENPETTETVEPLGGLASTTGNVYGIYDMSGGAWEYVMGNMSNGSGSYTYSAGSAGSNFTYSAETAKYLDTYAYGSSNSDQTAYNRARLGDATGENVLSTGGYGGWYGDYSYFVKSSYYWFYRGGVASDGADAGAFNFHNNDGVANIYYGARCVVVLRV